MAVVLDCGDSRRGLAPQGLGIQARSYFTQALLLRNLLGIRRLKSDLLVSSQIRLSQVSLLCALTDSVHTPLEYSSPCSIVTCLRLCLFESRDCVYSPFCHPSPSSLSATGLMLIK